MLKRIVALIVVSGLLPILAHAASWSLSTWARTAGGTIQVGSNAPQNSSQGVRYTSFTTNSPVTVTVTPNSGYDISQVNYNGTITYNPTETVYVVNGPNAQTVYAWFLAKRFSITSAVANGVGGTVKPASITNLLYGPLLTAAKTVTFTPESASYKVSSITGIPAGATQNPVEPVAGQAVTVTFPIGFTITSNADLVGTFTTQNPIAKAGNPYSAITGTTVTLDGSGSIPGIAGISSYAWSQVSGPTITLLSADTAKPRFSAAVPGSYRFALTVMPGGSTAFTTVGVSDSFASLERDQCYNCHSAAGVGVAANVFNNWSSSGHKAKGVVCAGCHVGANTGGHPGTLGGGSVNAATFNYTVIPSSGSGNFCTTCHSQTIVTDFAASKHSIRAGSAACSFCHAKGVHNPDAACTECHTADNSYGLEWPPAAFTFHSAFSGSASACKRCHTTHNPKVLGIKTGCP